MTTQVFLYQNTPITFNLNGEVMVNATEMAKPFGKQPASFLRNAQTEAFISALQIRIPTVTLLETVNGGVRFGTWMHQKLALKFAAWLSPEFELWVYDRIEELLTTGKTQLPALSDDELMAKALLVAHESLKKSQQRTQLLEQQNQLQDETIKAQAPVVAYANQVLNSESTYPITVIAQDFGLSAVKMNQKLEKAGIIRKVNGVWVISARYAGQGYTKTKNYPYLDSEGKQQTSLQLVWTQKGREFLHQKLNQADKAA